MRCHPRYDKGLLRINDRRGAPIDILRSDFARLGGMSEPCDCVDEGFEAGNDTCLSGMLVYFQLPQGLAPHDIFYYVQDEGIGAASEVCQP